MPAFLLVAALAGIGGFLAGSKATQLLTVVVIGGITFLVLRNQKII